MARKKKGLAKLAKYERRWVCVEQTPKGRQGPIRTSGMFVCNGKFWELDFEQGAQVFVEARMGTNERIRIIEVSPESSRSCFVPRTLKAGFPYTGMQIVKSRKDNRVLIIRVFRKSYGGYGAGFREDLNRTLASNRKIFLLNLSHLVLLGEELVGELVVFWRKCCEEKGIKLILCGLQKRVKDKLQETKLISLFTVYETEEEALDALAQQS